ncbi:hypothetical protein BCR42DRAFT_368376 [Absidia repens]|uniref:NAD(P)-binding protein n=1 Tax=Absidia repens TaxID=90262 RepID=A0A1X2IUL3_9FUNG|nr:hypothetical protein BCR42DRAFT_368376 [Absidia repens]
MTLEQDIALMSNKIAVVTGGSKGIGLAVCTALVARGVKVVIGDILIKEGQEAVAALNKNAGNESAVFQYCDVRKYDDLKVLFNVAETRFGGVDIAVLNAGIAIQAGGLFDPMEDESERFIHDVNVGGVIKGNKIAIMHMMKRKGGIIINTSSIAGIISGGGLGAYAATKHAVIGWTRSLEPLQSFNIRANAVCPYWTETDIIKLPPNPDGSKNDFLDVLDASPKAPMEHVVETFLSCIRNEEYAGEALIVAPDGCHEHPRSDLPESCVSESMLQALLEYQPKMLEKTKQKLEEASKAYFSKL